MIMRFGRYRGQDISEVPDDYLEWLERTQTCDLDQLRAAMEQRGLRTHRPQPRVVYQQPLKPGPLIAEMIHAGYRTLAKKYHPDMGGNTQQMQQLNEAFERWEN